MKRPGRNVARWSAWALAGAFSAASLAAFAGGISVRYGAAASPEVASTALSNSMVQLSRGRQTNTLDTRVLGYAYSSGEGEVKASSAATAAAVAEATVDNGPRRYTFRPPAGARFDGGKLIVYVALVDGDIAGPGTLEFSVDVAATKRGWPDRPSGGDRLVLADRPGSDNVELVAQVPLPVYLDSTATFDADMTLLLKGTANVPGGALQTASASAKSRIAGFSVLDASGRQVTGFTATGPKALTERVAPPPPILLAVEYYNASFGHFFVTAKPDEIRLLDGGTSWRRTSETFNVYATPDTGRVGVCRFMGEFRQADGTTKVSHFYALRGLGCEAVLANPGPWTYEGDVFFMPPPDTAGNCPSGTIPVYRLYNNGMTGAPNHRYTTSQETQADMLSQGYVREGAGPEGVAMCAPN